MKNKNILIVGGVILLALVVYIFNNNKDTTDVSYLSNTATSTTNTNTGTTKSGAVNTNTVTKTTSGGQVTPVTTTMTNAIQIGQRTLYNGIYITPVQVSYDGRCPVNIKCTQTGSFFDLGVILENNGVTQNVILSLNKPFTTSGKNIILTGVAPAKNSSKALYPSDYRFTFKVTN